MTNYPCPPEIEKYFATEDGTHHDPMNEQTDEGVLLKPKLWPCWLRRIFLLTLPVSFVLWILILGVLFVVACLYVAYIEIRPWFSAMWKNANDR